MANFKILLKKELKDFIYSYKCWITFLIVVFAQKLFFKLGNDYSLFFHAWFITTAIQQFLYDSLLTDVKDKGLFFLINLKINFWEYFLAKLIISFLVFVLLFLVEIKNILIVADFFTLAIVIFIEILTVPVMFLFTIFVNYSETGGLFSTTIFIGLLFILFANITGLVAVVLAILLNVIFVFLAYKLFNSVYFRKKL